MMDGRCGNFGFPVTERDRRGMMTIGPKDGPSSNEWRKSTGERNTGKREHRYGRTYWAKRMGWGYGDTYMEWMYEEYGSVKIISMITDQDWDSVEVEPPPADAAPVVNVDEDILQILAAEAHILRDEENLGDHKGGVGLVGWVQQMNDWEE